MNLPISTPERAGLHASKQAKIPRLLICFSPIALATHPTSPGSMLAHMGIFQDLQDILGKPPALGRGSPAHLHSSRSIDFGLCSELLDEHDDFWLALHFMPRYLLQAILFHSPWRAICPVLGRTCLTEKHASASPLPKILLRAWRSKAVVIKTCSRKVSLVATHL